MVENIINRVQKSGIITIDLDDVIIPENLFEIDVKNWLHNELFLKEKEYRNNILNHDWSKYKNGYVFIHCSSDAIIPTWAYMLISSKIEEVTNKVVIGDLKKIYDLIFEEYLNNLDFTKFTDKSVIIKGCSSEKIPLSAYHTLTTKLKPFAKSIMYGEACSAVPVFKKPK
tara:strand:+ start:1023 stop:1532 length:510 start_codon:yes stop_codon:yes gene_type:complete